MGRHNNYISIKEISDLEENRSSWRADGLCGRREDVLI